MHCGTGKREHWLGSPYLTTTDNDRSTHRRRAAYYPRGPGPFALVHLVHPESCPKFADALPWDRRRLACTKREARKTNEAAETPAVPGKSIRILSRKERIHNLAHHPILGRLDSDGWFVPLI